VNKIKMKSVRNINRNINDAHYLTKFVFISSFVSNAVVLTV
jgi:hypothetical protein